MDQVGPFTLSEILALVPAASPQLVKKVLQSLKQEGRKTYRAWTRRTLGGDP